MSRAASFDRLAVLLARPFVRSFACSFACSPARPFARSLVRSVACRVAWYLVAGAIAAHGTPAFAAAAPTTGAATWEPTARCLPSGGAPGAAAGPRLPIGGALGPGIGGMGIDEFVALFDNPRPRAAPTACDAPVPAAAAVRASSGAAEAASIPAGGVDRSAGNPVDVVTGNKYHRQVDAVMPHAQSSALSADGLAAAFGLSQDDTLNLLFARHYNSRSDFALSLGRGWSHSFDTRLARIARDGRIELQIVQADGRRLVFRALRPAKPRADPASPRSYGTGRIDDGRIDEQAGNAMAAFAWRWPGGRRVHFDADGRLSSIVSADGDTIRLRRDASGRLVEAADNAGRSFGFDYANARLSALRLPDGQQVRYEYDAHAQLAVVRFPDGRTQRYHYEDPRAFHLLTGVTDTDGRRSRYRYDDAQRVSESRAIGEAESRTMHFAWKLPFRAGASGRTTVRVGEAVSRFDWLDARGHAEPILLASSGDGCTRCPPMGLRSKADSRGRVASIGPLRLRYDAHGRLVERRVADARGRTQWLERRAFADAGPLSGPTRIEFPSVVAGRVARIELRYNDRAQVVSASFSGFAPDGDSALPIAVAMRLEYMRSGPAEGRLREITRVAPEGLQRTTFGHDAQRRLVSIMSGAVVRHEIERDALGRAIAERLPDGRTRRRSWDTNWRLVRTGAGGSSVEFEYDAAGRPRTLSWSGGERWNIALTSAGVAIESNHGWRERIGLLRNGVSRDGAAGGRRNAAGGQRVLPAARSAAVRGIPLAVVESGREGQRLVDLALRRTHWRRDDLGRLVELVTAHEGTRRYRHDGFGRLARIEHADGSVDAREYDGSGRILRRVQTLADERVETRYVFLGTQLVSVQHPEALSYARYDDEGRVIELLHRRAGRFHARGFSYDERGRLAEERLPDGSRLAHLHDARGVSRGLDLIGPTQTSARPLVRRVATKDGVQTTLALGNGVRYEQRHDASGLPLSMRWLPGAKDGDQATAAPLAFRELRWHPAGVPTSITHENGEDRYGYDRLGRLIVRERHVDAEAGAGPRHVEYFAVGALGERIGARRRDGSESTAPAVARDAAGRPRSVRAGALRYGAQRRIVEVAAEAGTVRYRYDAFGQRVSKAVSSDAGSQSRGFLYHDHRVVAETADDGRLQRQYLYWNRRPIAVLDHGGRHDALTWLHTDHLGTPIAASDESGRVVWRGDYDAYGALAGEQGGFVQPLRRPGQYFDAETGLHDNVLRTYDPDAGAYLEPDPLGLAAGFDAYLYADGNPLVASDPLGLILFAFDGTSHGPTGRDGEDVSNVRKFFEAYEDPDKWYMAGVGHDDAASGIAASALDRVEAATARARVDWMLGVLDGFLGDAWIGKVAPIDVVGFSRGAAMARDFVNGVSQMIDSGHFRNRGVCVDLRFLGLWDTIAQFGLLGSANDRWRLAIPSAVRATFHAVALNEHRSLFPLESALGSGAWVVERGFVGDHADVGGGNSESDLSDVSLVWISTMARTLGLPIAEPSIADRHVTDPRVHGRDYLGSGDRDVHRRDAAGRIVRETPMRRTAVGGMSWRESLRFLVPYPRRGIDASGQPSIVARVDMDAYAAWLKVSYGIDILH